MNACVSGEKLSIAGGPFGRDGAAPPTTSPSDEAHDAATSAANRTRTVLFIRAVSPRRRGHAESIHAVPARRRRDRSVAVLRVERDRVRARSYPCRAMDFCHLHVHSDFSLLDGTAPVDDL